MSGGFLFGLFGLFGLVVLFHFFLGVCFVFVWLARVFWWFVFWLFFLVVFFYMLGRFVVSICSFV